MKAHAEIKQRTAFVLFQIASAGIHTEDRAVLRWMWQLQWRFSHIYSKTWDVTPRIYQSSLSKYTLQISSNVFALQEKKKRCWREEGTKDNPTKLNHPLVWSISKQAHWSKKWRYGKRSSSFYQNGQGGIISQFQRKHRNNKMEPPNRNFCQKVALKSVGNGKSFLEVKNNLWWFIALLM